jgi:signal transduction histidine kinase
MTSLIFLVLLVVSLAHIALGLLVLTKNSRAIINRLFAGFTLFMSVSIMSNYFTDHSYHPRIFNAITFVTAGLVVLFLLLFAIHQTSTAKALSKSVDRIIVYAGLIISALGATTFVITGGRYVNGIYNVNFGPLAPVYFGYILAAFGAVLYVLMRAHHRLQGAEKIRIRFVLLSIFGGFIFVLISNVVIPAVFDSFNFVAIGPIGTIILALGISYSIVRHRLFNIRPIVARGVTYLMVLFVMGSVYTFGLFGISTLFFPQGSTSIAQTLVSTALALIIAFTFQPLRRIFERLTDKVFYRERYDSQVVLNDFSKILVSELRLDRLLKKSLTKLCEDLHIEFAQAVIFNNDRVYRVEHYGKLPSRLMVAPELKQLDRAMLVADELEGGFRKKLLEDHGIRISILLRTREEFIGYLLLGSKLSGDIYSTQDIKLLEIIGKEMAVAILNAKAYAEIEEFNRTLQARVDHATNRLRVANRHLKELDQAKDEFISMASHQLRTPLTTIKGYLSMMQEGDAGKLTPAQEEFVGYAFGSSERMVNLISDLLNVSRLSAGRFLIQTKPTDMVAMIRDEVRQLETHASAKHIKLIFEPPPHSLPPAEIDDNKTRQVVMNFIDNAIYYTQAGEVRVMLEQSGDKVRLEVHDTGIGVPEKARKKLFSKFFRADNAQVVRPDGTGLGLYLAKRVVEDQGGTILFNSVEGKGSMFGFELPFKPVKPIRETAHARKQ